MDEETICISRVEYQKLLDDSKKLSCLEAGGVDNWDWYSESLEGCYFNESDY